MTIEEKYNYLGRNSNTPISDALLRIKDKNIKSKCQLLFDVYVNSDNLHAYRDRYKCKEFILLVNLLYEIETKSKI
jgi:hypothetical protein